MKTDTFREFVLDQLATLRGVRSIAMFGGTGLYCGARFFGILFRNRLYFKVSAKSRTDYEAKGMKPFRPSSKQTLTSFYEVPVDILEEAETLVDWATTAVCAASPGRKPSRQQARTGRRPAVRRSGR